MPLITEKVAENSARCKECPVNLLRLKVDDENTLTDIITQFDAKKGAHKAADVFMNRSCKMCPYETDCKKVYGRTPGEYFT